MMATTNINITILVGFLKISRCGHYTIEDPDPQIQEVYLRLTRFMYEGNTSFVNIQPGHKDVEGFKIAIP